VQKLQLYIELFMFVQILWVAMLRLWWLPTLDRQVITLMRLSQPSGKLDSHNYYLLSLISWFSDTYINWTIWYKTSFQFFSDVKVCLFRTCCLDWKNKFLLFFLHCQLFFCKNIFFQIRIKTTDVTRKLSFISQYFHKFWSKKCFITFCIINLTL